MVIFRRIFKVAAVVTAFCALLAFSCTKQDAEVTLDVSAEYPTLSARAGEIFIRVRSNSDWTAYLADDNTGSPIDWARLNATSGSGDRNLILSYDANTHETQARKVRITVSCGKIAKMVTVEQVAAGVQPEPDPDPVPPSTDLSKVNWMELPAMNDPDLGYYSHSFEMNGQTYRNYSFGWSQKDLVSLWVAYPLCKMYTNKSVNRTDDWDLDPLLGNLSSAPFGGYGGSYARGHQVPSADRLCCYEANAQTFYGTNITPQLNAHNEGIWQKLEDKVRTVANASDTTYVVTGVLVKDSKTFTEDSDGKKMTVPTAYFKALLRYSRSSTLGQWNAAAFYLEHRSYSEGLGKQHSMSIDELEEITGLDFFVNLKDKVGEEQAKAIEAADPAASSVWW